VSRADRHIRSYNHPLHGFAPRRSKVSVKRIPHECDSEARSVRSGRGYDVCSCRRVPDLWKGNYYRKKPFRHADHPTTPLDPKEIEYEREYSLSAGPNNTAKSVISASIGVRAQNTDNHFKAERLNMNLFHNCCLPRLLLAGRGARGFKGERKRLRERSSHYLAALAISDESRHSNYPA
jgi:hypothetical protein